MKPSPVRAAQAFSAGLFLFARAVRSHDSPLKSGSASESISLWNCSNSDIDCDTDSIANPSIETLPASGGFLERIQPRAGLLLKLAGTVRASLDGFHNPREQRFIRGAFSPEGYFHDSFDYAFLVEQVIKPAKAARHRTTLRAARFDVRTDREVSDISVEIHARSIVLFDGIFLFRPELVGFCDYRIFVEIGFDTSLVRGIARDAASMGGEAAARERYLRRYIPGQRLYFEAARPVEPADAVVRNDDPARRRIVLASQPGALSPADG